MGEGAIASTPAIRLTPAGQAFAVASRRSPVANQRVMPPGDVPGGSRRQGDLSKDSLRDSQTKVGEFLQKIFEFCGERPSPALRAE